MTQIEIGLNNQINKCSILLASVLTCGTVTMPLVNNDVYDSSLENGVVSSLSFSAVESGISYSLISVKLSRDEGVVMPLDLTANLCRLNDFLSLQLGDDNEISFSDSFVRLISNVLVVLPKQPEVYPTMSGNIQLEYENYDNGNYLEIEITPDGLYRVYKIDQFGNETIMDTFVTLDLDSIKEEVQKFEF